MQTASVRALTHFVRLLCDACVWSYLQHAISIEDLYKTQVAKLTSTVERLQAPGGAPATRAELDASFSSVLREEMRVMQAAFSMKLAKATQEAAQKSLENSKTIRQLQDQVIEEKRINASLVDKMKSAPAFCSHLRKRCFHRSLGSSSVHLSFTVLIFAVSTLCGCFVFQSHFLRRHRCCRSLVFLLNSCRRRCCCTCFCSRWLCFCFRRACFRQQQSLGLCVCFLFLFVELRPSCSFSHAYSDAHEARGEDSGHQSQVGPRSFDCPPPFALF